MKKILIVLVLNICLLLPQTIKAKESTKSFNDVTSKRTVIEKLPKEKKLYIIYISGAVIVISSVIVLYPIIKEKRK